MSRPLKAMSPAIALIAALGLVLTACGSSKKSSSSSSNTTASAGGVSCNSGTTIAFFGALTGDNANLGVNIEHGSQLAVNEWNKQYPNCQVKLKGLDSQGSPDQAPQLAQKAITDKNIVAIVGPAFSGESRAADPAFNEAGLPTVTPSATGVDLSTKGWTIFHRAVGNDNSQGPAAADYIKNELKATKVAVIDDQSEYGKGIADIVKQKLGSMVVASDSTDPNAQDYSSTVSKVNSAKPDVVFYGGYYSAGGRMLKQLREAGVTAKFVSDDGSLDPGLVKAAGASNAEGAILTCPCAPITAISGGQQFQTDYKAAFGADPGTYSAEAFDSANAILEAVKNGNKDRKSINDYLNSKLDYKGLTKTLKFDDKGEIANVTVYAYQVKNGAIEPIGPIGG
jgi:branched-chain amino acid transport system substrate-binding protein